MEAEADFVGLVAGDVPSAEVGPKQYVPVGPAKRNVRGRCHYRSFEVVRQNVEAALGTEPVDRVRAR